MVVNCDGTLQFRRDSQKCSLMSSFTGVGSDSSSLSRIREGTGLPSSGRCCARQTRVVHSNRIAASKLSPHPASVLKMAQRRPGRILGQRHRPCLPSTPSLRLQLSPSPPASTMRPVQRSERVVSPSATAPSDTMAASPRDTSSP